MTTEPEVIFTEQWVDYGIYRAFYCQNRFGYFWKAMSAGDDPKNPEDGHAYARSWRRAVAYLMMMDAKELITASRTEQDTPWK